jgi:hypothetical protein
MPALFHAGFVGRGDRQLPGALKQRGILIFGRLLDRRDLGVVDPVAPQERRQNGDRAAAEGDEDHECQQRPLATFAHLARQGIS